MYLSRKVSRARIREAQNARNNRAEIVKGLADGQITRRDLFKWGLFTMSGMLLEKNGLSPFAGSAYARSVPTGTPPSPLFGAREFSQPMPRLNLQTPVPMSSWINPATGDAEAVFGGGSDEGLNARRLSYHTDFDTNGSYANPRTGRGPCEGRPPGEWFAHQRWDEFFPKTGYVMSVGRAERGTKFHRRMPKQNPDSVWAFNEGRFSRGRLAPPLIKGRYGEPMICRIYNNLPTNRAKNGGFGRNQISTHFHNAHNGAESDGACNAFHYPGTFYDYHWGTTLARHDTINTGASDPRASGPDGSGGLIHVPGDFRELQSTMWFHDHRFFFTADNVYKGMAGMINYYSGPDRGHEALDDGVNLRLPSGTLLDSGNLDFDVNLQIADLATDPEGQMFFDIFDTDGFLGDILHVNYAYKPYLEVLPRKYRFRILNGCVARFFQLAIVDQNRKKVPFQFIANDGNLLVNPLDMNKLTIQAPAERFDIVVDFSVFRPGQRISLVNLLEQTNGRGPEDAVKIREALAGVEDDPAVGALMQFRVVDAVESVDVPGVIHRATDPDRSRVPQVLTEQIPLVEPVRKRFIEWKRGDGDSLAGGACIPDCEGKESFPWVVSVNGETAHSLNANRISNLIPRPGETEHWTISNSSGGWSHPIHLHFEEGVTFKRRGAKLSDTEDMVRKDVWRLGPNEEVTFQVSFGEYGGAYVTHCHNTVHEDFAMLARFDLLTDPYDNPGADEMHAAIIPTPMPTEDGCDYVTPEVLREGDPRDPGYRGRRG